MSKFKWNDKSAVKWFVIYAQGHEGPYSLEYLEQKIKESTFNDQTKVWSEGLKAEMTLEAVLTLARPLSAKPLSEPPPLPPLPEEKQFISPKVMQSPPIADYLEEDDEDEVGPEEAENSSPPRPAVVFSKRWIKFMVSFVLMTLAAIGIFYYLQDQQKKLEIFRPQGMSLKASQRIQDGLEFRGWNEALFFKEFISEDYSSLWLASASFHQCQVNAHFKSQSGKLLSLVDEEVEFEATGTLRNHLTEFNKFNFSAGKKIVPGMYEMTIHAQGCEWDGLVAQLMNMGKPVDSEYSAKMTVILYSGGAAEFRELLERVVRKKLEKSVIEQNQLELFWQGIQEKLQTLLAVTLQVEQLFLDFVAKDTRQFHVNVQGMVNDYTKRFGPFLTNFVVANQDNFKELSKSDLRGVSTRKNYEYQISQSARHIGFTAMKLIEDFEKLKNPRRVQLNSFEQRVKKEFAKIKSDLNQKIIQVSDDRSLSPVEDSAPQNLSPE